ncbi:MAG: DUF423 domain-containing protein [Phaeodactylibacter sp.]|nr:DUF423 domain-containing protein [Phaeodactylibacter sp.]MCB9273514.1 DUF423 domain-containing protein [Lewinellaceae bacterium]
MRKTFLRLGSLMALAAVAIGAFGSHGLKSMLSPEQLNTYEIGVRYQFYHAFAILAVGVLLYFRKTSLLPWAGWFFAAGIVLFSGSLYFLAIREVFQLSMDWLGPVTPTGGICFILGWALLLASTYQENQKLYRSRNREEPEQTR